MKSAILSVIILLSSSLGVLADEKDLTQTIRGKVIDVDSRTPLIGATIILLGSDPTNIDLRS